MTDIHEFKAPSWATGWCARCEFTSTCVTCRHKAGIDFPHQATA